MSDSERRLLTSLLAEVHRRQRNRTPPFEDVWSRAVAESAAARAARPRKPRIRLAVAAAAVAVAVLGATIGWWIDSRRSRELDRALAAAAAVGEWRAPLDFLLETPGREWLASTPRWGPGADAASWSLAPPELPETAAPEPDST